MCFVYRAATLTNGAPISRVSRAPIAVVQLQLPSDKIGFPRGVQDQLYDRPIQQQEEGKLQARGAGDVGKGLLKGFQEVSDRASNGMLGASIRHSGTGQALESDSGSGIYKTRRRTLLPATPSSINWAKPLKQSRKSQVPQPIVSRAQQPAFSMARQGDSFTDLGALKAPTIDGPESELGTHAVDGEQTSKKARSNKYYREWKRERYRTDPIFAAKFRRSNWVTNNKRRLASKLDATSKAEIQDRLQDESREKYAEALRRAQLTLQERQLEDAANASEAVDLALGKGAKKYSWLSRPSPSSVAARSPGTQAQQAASAASQGKDATRSVAPQSSSSSVSLPSKVIRKQERAPAALLPSIPRDPQMLPYSPALSLDRLPPVKRKFWQLFESIDSPPRTP